jgi:hypothetical protein
LISMGTGVVSARSSSCLLASVDKAAFCQWLL